MPEQKPKNPAAVELGKLGGDKRKETLSTKRKREIAKAAAAARWAGHEAKRPAASRKKAAKKGKTA